MPATGGGRAAHTVPSKRPEKGKSTQSMQPPRRESSAGATAQRPGVKTRAYSAPNAPNSDADAADDLETADEDKDGDAIADDAFFQRYHFPLPVAPTKEEPSDSSLDSSSDTEGPLSPNHVKHRQPAGDVPSEPSTGVGLVFAPLQFTHAGR